MNIVSTSEFEALTRKIRRTYRHVDQDIAVFSAVLKDGVRPQDTRLQNMGGMEIYKARLPNTSARAGTRGGCRVVYRVKEDTVILLLLIWAKSRAVDIPDAEIRRVASQY